MKLYAIGDTHFSHYNIMKYCNRPFQTIEEMDKHMIETWNSIVTENDTVIHVGDFSFGKRKHIEEIYHQLNGKIILIKGNHDRQSFTFYHNLFYFICDSLTINKWIFTHTPMKNIANTKINVHGHVHNSKDAEQWISNNRMNVSVEVIDYKPVLLKTY